MDNPQPSGSGTSRSKDDRKDDPSKVKKSSGSIVDKVANSIFNGMNESAKQQIRELHEHDAVTFNPAVLPAGLSASAENTSLSGILRSLLSTHQGPLADITETQLAKALSSFTTQPQDKGELVKVLAPTEFGSAELTEADQNAWRSWAKDAKSGIDLAAIFRYCTRYHQERNCRFSEKSLRENLIILCPREIISSLNSKVEKGYGLQRIFDDLLLLSDSIMSSEEIRLEVERVLAHPSDPIAALRTVLSLLEKNPTSSNAALDAECLAEAKRLVRRLGGNNLYGNVEALFLHRRSQDFINYYDILKSVYAPELTRLAKTNKSKLHHVDDSLETSSFSPDKLEAAIDSKFSQYLEQMDQKFEKFREQQPPQPTQPASQTPTQPPPPQEHPEGSMHTLLMNQLLHNIQAQNYQQSPKNKVRSDKSQKSRRNRPQDGSRTQYKHKLCGLHALPNHTNQECRRQKAWPCPLHGPDHHAGQCHRVGDYIHIPNLTVYSSDSERAQFLCTAAGYAVTPSDRPPRTAGPPEAPPAPLYPQLPQAPYNYNAWAMASAPRMPTSAPNPNNFKPPLYEPRQAHPMDLASNAPMQLNHIPSSNTSSTNTHNGRPDPTTTTSSTYSIMADKLTELTNLVKGYPA